MTVLKLDINRRDYEVVCNEGEEDNIMQLSFELDRRVKELYKVAGTANQTTLLMMAGLQLVEELQQIKNSSGGSANIQSSGGAGEAFAAKILSNAADAVEEVVNNLAKKVG